MSCSPAFAIWRWDTIPKRLWVRYRVSQVGRKRGRCHWEVGDCLEFEDDFYMASRQRPVGDIISTFPDLSPSLLRQSMSQRWCTLATTRCHRIHSVGTHLLHHPVAFSKVYVPCLHGIHGCTATGPRDLPGPWDI
jgi:hypothetical protein